MKKKEYISPEFEEIKVVISNSLMDVSTESVIHDGEREASDW